MMDLRLGDCLGAQGMPALEPASVDVVLTDPPYSEHVHANQVRTRKGKKPDAKIDLGFRHLSKTDIRMCCEQFARVCKTWVLVFSDLEGAHYWREAFEDARIRYIRTGIWHRSNAMPQKTGDRPAASCEAIVVGHVGDGRMLWNGGGHDLHFDGPSEQQNRVHEAQKPIWLVEQLIGLFTARGALVLDPFAGSGTTGVGCKRRCRGFVGWERDETHHVAAAARIAVTQEQFTLFQGGEDARQVEAWR